MSNDAIKGSVGRKHPAEPVEEPFELLPPAGVPVAVGVAAGVDSGWSFSRVGSIAFSGSRVLISSRSDMGAAGAAAGITGIVTGPVGGAIGGAVIGLLNAGMQTLETDSSRLRAAYDEKRGLAKLELPDGRWAVIIVTNQSAIVGRATREAMAKLDFCQFVVSPGRTIGYRPPFVINH